MAWEMLNKVGNVADLFSLFFDFKNFSAVSKIAGLFTKRRSAGVTEAAANTAATPGATGAPAPAPTEEAITTNSWGESDERGLLALMSLFGVSARPTSAEVTTDERTAFGYFVSELTQGEGATLLRIIARGGEQEIRVTVTRTVPAPVAGDPSTKVTRDYTVKATLRGIGVIKGIATDILAAGATPAERQTKARAMAALVRGLGILDNLGDNAAKLLAWAKNRLPVEFGSGVTLKLLYEAAQRVGWRTVVSDILLCPNGVCIRRQIAEAADEAAKAHWHGELQRLIVDVTTLVYRSRPRPRWLAWSNGIAFIGVPLMIALTIIVLAIQH